MNLFDFSEKKRELDVAKKNLAAYHLRQDKNFRALVDDIARTEDKIDRRRLAELLATYVFDRAWDND